MFVVFHILPEDDLLSHETRDNHFLPKWHYRHPEILSVNLPEPGFSAG
jgi:hypothetical protein